MRKVKHCVEIECAQESCTRGGIGFGNNGSYIRYSSDYDFPGNTNVKFIKQNNFYITINDTNRILVCLDNTQIDNQFTVIKNNTIRTHSFRFIPPIDTLKIITYQGSNTTNVRDQLLVYTHKNEFQNETPAGYRGWGDGVIITCYNKRNYISLSNILYLFVILI